MRRDHIFFLIGVFAGACIYGWMFRKEIAAYWKSLPIILLLLTSTAAAAECRNVRCLDGDTFTCVLRLEFGVLLDDGDVVHIRMADYDAWETSYRRQTIKYAPDEIERGKAAKAALEEILGSAKLVEAREVKSKDDPYGRRLAKIYADGIDVGAALRSQGHERKNPPAPAKTSK